MDFKFNALSQTPDGAAEAEEEGRMFAMEMASENPEHLIIGEPPGDGRQSEAGASSSTEDGGSAAEEVAPEESSPTTEIDSVKPEAETTAPETEPVPEKEDKSTATSFDSLIRLAAGEVDEDEVKIDAPSNTVPVSAFQALESARQRDPEAERQIDDLVSSLTSTSEPEELPPRTGDRGQAAVRTVTQPAPPPGPMMAAPGGASVQLADMAGSAIAGAIATPFLALSSAAKHLSSRFHSAGAVPGGPSRVTNSLLANTLETITDWKCEQIVKAGESVKRAAADLRGTEDFLTWEDDARNMAASHGVSVDEVVRDMHVKPEFGDLKDKMDRLWASHPDKVENFRAACGDFERNIRNVVKEFPNSEEDVKKRVMNAMTEVQADAKGIPGFGDKIGEYTRTLSERVRELAKTIMEFMTSLARRLGVNTRSSDLSM